MSWTYRVVKEILRGPKPVWKGRRDAVPAQVYYSIREVYTRAPRHDAPATQTSWSASPCAAGGETLEELKADYALQAKAFELPTLIVQGNAILGEEQGPDAAA